MATDTPTPIRLPDGAAVAEPQSNFAPELAESLNMVLANIFALYVKTKSFHWHMSGPHFRDYHLLLDEQADQIFAMTDVVAERVRKIGATTLRSLGHAHRLARIPDNDGPFGQPEAMLSELAADNAQLLQELRQAHALCDERGDVATAGLLETFIDEGERRVWFLLEVTRGAFA
jgi:starvation-inducible DNA-binding protein